MRKLPLGLSFAADFDMGMIAAVGGRPHILLGIREFVFTIFYFLVLMALFNDLTLRQYSTICKIAGKIKAFLTEEEIYFGVKTGDFFIKSKYALSKSFPKTPFPRKKQRNLSSAALLRHRMILSKYKKNQCMVKILCPKEITIEHYPLYTFYYLSELRCGE